MARFDATPMKSKLLRKGSVLVLSLSILFGLSGCEHGVLVDGIIPDVNKEQKLLTEGTLVEYNFDDSSRIIYSGTALKDPILNPPTEGGLEFPDEGNSGLKAGPNSYDRPVVDTDFERPAGFWDYELMYPHMQRVYVNVCKKLEGKKDVYFRVLVSGTTQKRETKTVYDDGTGKSGDVIVRTLVTGNTYDQTYNPSNLTTLGGTSIDTFLYQWLSPLDINKDCHSLSTPTMLYVSTLDRLMDSVRNGGSATYTDVTETLTAPITKRMLGSTLVEMWSRVHEEAPTLKEFRDLLSRYPERVLVDMTMEYYTSWNVRKTVVLHPFAMRTSGAAKTSNTSVANVNAAFCSYNQYHTRSSANTLTRWGVWGSGSGNRNPIEDESSKLYCFVDGYNKYLVYLAVADGKTFKDVFTSGELAVINSELNSISCPSNAGHAADGWDYDTYWISN